MYQKYQNIAHDKKTNHNTVSIIKVKKAGTYSIEEFALDEIKKILERGPYEK